MMEDDDDFFLQDRSIPNDEKARRIAEALRKDNPSRLFLRELAMMFAPAHERQKPPAFRAIIKGPGGRPPSKPVDAAGEFMADLVKRDGWKPEAAAQEAMDKFGISRRTAFGAYRQELRDREAAKRFAEAGVVGFDDIVQEWW
ncbi:MAG: hypothetical protein ED558_13790 [Oricola sp.]|nr:MAG: hypothetical protein ED558_13790 [Oricola sp.]